MPKPNSRDWKATEDRQPGPSGPTLRVTGQFESTNSSQRAYLKEAVPQGINPAILILDLVIVSEGTGATVMDWKDVEPFKKNVSLGQHTSVTIQADGDLLAQCKVEVVH